MQPLRNAYDGIPAARRCRIIQVTGGQRIGLGDPAKARVGLLNIGNEFLKFVCGQSTTRLATTYRKGLWAISVEGERSRVDTLMLLALAMAEPFLHIPDP